MKHARAKPSSGLWHRMLLPLTVAAAFSILYVAFGDSILVVKRLLRWLPMKSPVSLNSVLVSGSSALGITPPHGDMPLTLVDIDEALYTSWGRPCITPRDRLKELIQAVAERNPAVIVVDVDLSCGESDTGLAAYLASYAGSPPLILLRGMHIEPDPAVAGGSRVRMDATPYDDAVAANPRISWGHTFYLTDEDGTVRRWRDWWEVCTDTGTATIPAVPLRILAVLPGAGGTAPPPLALTHRGECGLESQSSPEHIVVLGPRILGHGHMRASADTAAPRVLQARQILDSAYAVEPKGYFSLENRVVIVGATHSGSRDFWRTAIGYMSGIELIAHTARFAPIQLAQAEEKKWVPHFLAVVAFLALAVIFFVFRPAWASLLGIAAIFAMIHIAVAWRRYEIFGSMEAALWLFAMHELVVGVARAVSGPHPHGLRQRARRIFLSDQWLGKDQKGTE